MNDDESLVLLKNIFQQVLKKNEEKEDPQGSRRTNNFQKNKKATNTVENKKPRKGI